MTMASKDNEALFCGTNLGHLVKFSLFSLLTFAVLAFSALDMSAQKCKYTIDETDPRVVKEKKASKTQENAACILGD